MKPRLIVLFLLGGLVAICFGQNPPAKPKPAQDASPAAKPAETASAPEAKKTERRRVVTDLSGFDLLDPAKVKKQTMVAAATRGGPRATALAPKLAKLYGARPLFQWSYAGKASQFVFVLMDDAQEELLKSEVSGTQFRYPGSAPPLAPGRTYFWMVEPLGMVAAEPSTPAGLVVVPAAQRQDMDQRLAKISEADAYAADRARAQVFTDQRLWYDAIAAYTDLIAQHPERAELFEQRGTIYAQLEVTHGLADQDFARADELREKQ